MNLEPLNVEYAIVDDEHPERSQVVNANAPGQAMETPEQQLERIRYAVRAQLVAKILARREAENKRSLLGRTVARRRKEKAAKASRKQNRG